MSYLDCFQMPRPVKIMGLTSTVRKSFVNGIVPCAMPSEYEVREAHSVLGMTEERWSYALLWHLRSSLRSATVKTNNRQYAES